MVLNNCQFLKPLVLPAALKQFEYQGTNRQVLAASKEYGDSGITQTKDVKKTPAKLLLSTPSKHCMPKIFGLPRPLSVLWKPEQNTGICSLVIRPNLWCAL